MGGLGESQGKGKDDRESRKRKKLEADLGHHSREKGLFAFCVEGYSDRGRPRRIAEGGMGGILAIREDMTGP
jgi:hypothetical protein